MLFSRMSTVSNIPCSSYDEDGEEEENEACQELYEDAAKCESYNGFAGTDYYSANQAANEEVVCDFISQIKKGTYDASSGEIVLQFMLPRFILHLLKVPKLISANKVVRWLK